MILNRAKNTIGLKRPLVLFALIFAFSAIVCSVSKTSFLYPAAIGAVALILTVVLMCFRFDTRKLIFCFMLSLSFILPSFISALNEYRAADMILKNKSEFSSKAVVSEKWQYGGTTVIFATPYDKQSYGSKIALIYDEDVVCETFDVVFAQGIMFETKDSKSFTTYSGDYLNKNRLLSKGCFSAVYAEKISVNGRIPEKDQGLMHKYYFYISDSVKKHFDIIGHTDTFSYAKALLTGDRSSMPKNISDAFSHSGLLPILCISGLHVVISSTVLEMMFKKLRMKATLRNILLILFLIFLIIITGGRGSVVRACIMSCIFKLFKLFGYHSDSFSALAFAFIVISITNPYCVLDIGTFLSFTAMAGMLLSSAMYDSLHSELFGKFISVKYSIFTGFLAQSFVYIPLCHFFGGAYLLSVFSNFFASFVFTPLMYFLVLTAIFCFLPSAVIPIFTLPAQIFIAILDMIAKIFCRIPFSYAEFELPYSAFIIFIVLFSVYFLAVSFCKNRIVIAAGITLSIFANVCVILLHFLSIIYG